MARFCYTPGILSSCCLLFLFFCGCGPQETDKSSKIILQTDWFAQPEHGGFYQALARGFYQEAGLDVEIHSGGPNAMTSQKILRGRAHFAMNRADTIYRLVTEGAPFHMVMATLQNDPQGILLHASNPISSIQELDGKRVMAIPGLAWIDYVERKFDIRLDIIPHDFGMERFLNDPDFIQQCLVTNEPFYARQQGVEVKVLPMRDTGFNPYHGIYCLQELLDKDPDLVERFVTASIRGWEDYIQGDPQPAFDLIARENPKMNQQFMEFCYGILRSDNLVTGDPEKSESVGNLDPKRIRAMEKELRQLGIIQGRSSQKSWFTNFKKAPVTHQ